VNASVGLSIAINDDNAVKFIIAVIPVHAHLQS
jgi:hypothetical protein